MRLRAFLLALLPLAAVAQTAGDTLDVVTVTAARVAVPTAEAPVRVAVLGREAIDAAASASIADVLGARAPLHVRRYGPSGLATVTMRGTSASQTLVLLDGQPLSDPQLGQVDLSLLPTGVLEGAEVLSGPASGLYGSAAVGGVVHLRTPDTGAARLAISAGPWGERRADGVASGRMGPVRALFATDLALSDGDYAVRDRSRIGAPRVAREGWDARKGSAYGRLAAGDGNAGVAVALWAADAERGLGGDGTTGERQWDRRTHLVASAHRDLRQIRVAASATHQRTRLRYANPYPSTRSDALDETGRTETTTLEARASTPPNRAWHATALVTSSWGRGEHPSLEDALDRSVGLAASARGGVGRLVLFPAFRIDHYAPTGGTRRLAVAPQIGTNLALGSHIRLKASVARAFRMPTLNDRFWNPGGDPTLRPERGWSADAGLVWQGRRAHVEATGFAARLRDQIVWSPTDAGFWAPANVARTQSLGVELSGEARRPLTLAGRSSLVTAGALATALDARDLDSGFARRYVPRWTAKGWGSLEIGAVRLDLGARVVGPRFTTASESLALPAYAVVDGQLSARRALGPLRLTVAVSAENLLDAEVEVIRSHAMPPRHARLRLTLSR